ncbi:MAG: hypothetical protein HY540_07530 [Deltaproteobacteria bacterium]|nr:hypothetical protein [Deltaproteobacteria bacterium]
MAEPKNVAPIFMRNLCGKHDALLKRPGTHTVTGPSGHIDLRISVEDTNDDGNPDAVTLEKYGRFLDTKIPRVIARDNDGDGIVDDFKIVAQLYDHKTLASDLHFTRVGRSSYFRTTENYYPYGSHSSTQSIMSIGAYDLMSSCEWNADEDWTSLCSWLSEKGTSDVVARTASVAKQSDHPAQSATDKYVAWCRGPMTAPDTASLDGGFSIRTRTKTSQDYDGILPSPGHGRFERTCEAKCTVKRKEELLREVNFTFTGQECAGITDAKSATVQTPNTLLQNIPVNVVLTPTEVRFAPGSRWIDNVYTKYCEIKSALPRSYGARRELTSKLFLDGGCNATCSANVRGHIVSSILFVDNDCDGYPEWREATEYPLPAEGKDSTKPLYTETIAMSRPSD